MLIEMFSRAALGFLLVKWQYLVVSVSYYTFYQMETEVSLLVQKILNQT